MSPNQPANGLGAAVTEANERKLDFFLIIILFFLSQVRWKSTLLKSSALNVGHCQFKSGAKQGFPMQNSGQLRGNAIIVSPESILVHMFRG